MTAKFEIDFRLRTVFLIADGKARDHREAPARVGRGSVRAGAFRVILPDDVAP
jgi:hypothetical protein